MTGALVVLAVTVAMLLAERVRSQVIHERELRYLLNMVQAKTVPEFVALQRADAPRAAPVGSEDREVIHPIGA